MKNSHVTTILVFALSIGLYATEYFVSPRGSDHHDGSRKHPFQTIRHATDLVTPGDTVTLHNGTYRETSTSANLDSPKCPSPSAACPTKPPP